MIHVMMQVQKVKEASKTPKNSDTQKFAVITLNFEEGGFSVE